MQKTQSFNGLRFPISFSQMRNELAAKVVQNLGIPNFLSFFLYLGINNYSVLLYIKQNNRLNV